ncbi:hypothetical protein PIB30_085750 [Stylosanthes scabra]|uniref:Uncharacterized protein n=1 Tax=Stylosanthes scabra TaxID=79078 RepID=A0ABU6ZRI5_9FABA|nr:hypothetical protein [Stylosanthes scabra]
MRRMFMFFSSEDMPWYVLINSGSFMMQIVKHRIVQAVSIPGVLGMFQNKKKTRKGRKREGEENQTLEDKAATPRRGSTHPEEEKKALHKEGQEEVSDFSKEFSEEESQEEIFEEEIQDNMADKVNNQKRTLGDFIPQLLIVVATVLLGLL